MSSRIINPQTGEFTFTPEIGFNGSPKPVTYDGVNKENGLKATGGQVAIYYPLPVTKPATTAAEQGVTQISTDSGDQDAGLTPDQMFPPVPKEWYGEPDRQVKFYINNAAGENVTTLTVHTKDQETGQDIEAGTYTIDPVTGIVTFKPNPAFLGAAPAATIVTTGLTDNLETEYTPYYYPVRVELPSDRQVQETLGAPTSSKFVDSQWNTKDFQVDKDTISILNGKGEPVGTTYTVPGEGTWTVTVTGDKPATGPDTREVTFTFTPEKGFIGQPTELEYTAKNTNGVPSNTPGQVVFVYPEPTPQDAITTAKQGVVQNSDDKDAGDQGLTVEEMFPRIKEVPADWNLTYVIDGATDNKLVVDGQGTYQIDPATGIVTFTPLPDFVGTAKPATIVVYADGNPTAGKAKYTAVVEAFGDPEYHQVVVSAGETKTSPVTPPADAPEGAPKYSLPADGTAPEGWTVTIDETTGEVKAVAPKNESQMVAFEVPVTATYPGDVVRETIAPFSPLEGNMGSPEYKQVVVNTGETKTSPVTPPADAPAGDPKYVIDPSFTAPEGWTVSIDETTGEVTAVAPNNAAQMVAFEVPVTATYLNNEVRTTTAPFSPLKSDFPAPDYNQVIVETGATQTSKITPAENAPAGDVKYAIDPNWTAPVGWTVTIAEDGTVTAVAPNDATQMVAFEVPVTATYADGQTRKTSAPFSPLVTTTREIMYETEIIYDDAIPAGTNTVEQEGVKGEESYANGTWTETKAPVKQIVRIGTKANVGENEVTWTKPIPFETTVRVNPDLAPGEIKTVTEGVVGEETFTQKVSTDGNGNVTLGDTTSTVTKEKVDAVIEIGPEDTSGTIERQFTTEIPFDTQYIIDNTLPAGTQVVDQEGVPGSETTTFTQQVENSQPVGEPATSVERVEPVTKIVRIGAFQQVPEDPQTERIPFETNVTFNPDLEPGTQRVIQQGKDGVRKLVDGEWVEVTPPTPAIIEVGAKVVAGSETVTWTAPVDFDVEVRVNPGLAPGEYRTVQEGVPGEQTFAQTMSFDTQGNVTKSEPVQVVTKQPVKEIIEVGPSVTGESQYVYTEEIPYGVKYVYDPTIPAGESRVVTPGQAGESTTTVPLTLKDGSVVGDPVRATDVTRQPVNEVVHIGTRITQGTQNLEWVANVPFGTEVRYNPDLAPGEHVVVQEGIPDQDKYTAVVTMDGNGNITTTNKVERITDPTNMIVEYGPVQTESEYVYTYTSEQPYEVEVIYDDTLRAGQTVVDQEGSVGQTRYTVTQKIVNSKTDGDPTVTEDILSTPVKKIVRVGTACTCGPTKPVDPVDPSKPATPKVPAKPVTPRVPTVPSTVFHPKTDATSLPHTGSAVAGLAGLGAVLTALGAFLAGRRKKGEE